jgi:hypothetical protein
MVLIAGRAKPKQAVVLESPDGRRLTYGATSPNVRWFAGQAYDMVTVVKPAPGYWQLSQHTPEEGKVILITDLKLLCPHVPLEPGADEALVVGATLTDNDQPVNNPDILSQTAITGELLTAGRDPVRIELHPPHPEDSSWWPPGTLMGRFPPVLTSGGWRLRVMAQGKTFQREQNYYLNVNSPWYQVELAPQEAGQPYRLICQPHPGRRPENLSAWLNIQSPSGMVTGNLFIPPAGSGFMLPLAPELPGAYLISLQFTGHTPDRRPLVLQPGPWHLDLPDAAASRKSLPLESKESSLKLPRLPQIPWLAFLTNIFGGSALIFLAILIILAGLSITAIVAAVRWRRRGGKTVKVFQNLGGSSETFDVPLEKLNLLLKAQVESLEKERSRLKAALDELQKERDRLFQENSQLSNSLDNQSKTSMDSIKVIGELEQRLQDAETEAKSVQEEYMALFARSQREKDTLKKQ